MLSLNFPRKADKKCFPRFLCGRISKVSAHIVICVVFLRIMIWSHSIILTVDPVLPHNSNWGWQTEFGGFPGRRFLECEARAARDSLFLHRAPKITQAPATQAISSMARLYVL